MWIVDSQLIVKKMYGKPLGFGALGNRLKHLGPRASNGEDEYERFPNYVKEKRQIWTNIYFRKKWDDRTLHVRTLKPIESSNWRGYWRTHRETKTEDRNLDSSYDGYEEKKLRGHDLIELQLTSMEGCTILYCESCALCVELFYSDKLVWYMS